MDDANWCMAEIKITKNEGDSGAFPEALSWTNLFRSEKRSPLTNGTIEAEKMASKTLTHSAGEHRDSKHATA